MKNYKNGKLKIFESTFFKNVFHLATMLVKANLIEKVIFAQKLGLPIQPSQEEREKRNFKCKAQQIEH